MSSGLLLSYPIGFIVVFTATLAVVLNFSEESHTAIPNGVVVHARDMGPFYRDKAFWASVASPIATRILYAEASASSYLPSSAFSSSLQLPSIYNFDLAYKNHYLSISEQKMKFESTPFATQTFLHVRRQIQKEDQWDSCSAAR